MKREVSIEGWKEQELLGFDKAARVLDVSVRTVWRLVAEGALRLTKVRGAAKVKVSELKEYVERITKDGAKGGVM